MNTGPNPAAPSLWGKWIEIQLDVGQKHHIVLAHQCAPKDDLDGDPLYARSRLESVLSLQICWDPAIRAATARCGMHATRFSYCPFCGVALTAPTREDLQQPRETSA
ncbi:hypothetical protein HY632_04750 [Candidatus Uhrbacteria bacterium]|nr:hypothetical protein [Candidatus Uhrbacteria bacterium]